MSAAPAVDPAVRQEQTQAAIDSSEMTEEQKQQAKAYDAYGSEMSEKMKDSYRKAGAPVDGP